MKLPQTLIIESGDKKKRLESADALIRKEMCLERNADLKCKCKSCHLLKKLSHPDFVKISKSEDKKNISVAQIRSSLSKIYSRPLISEVMCILIEDAQTLSHGAQNALLKTLEEPPQYVRLVLLTDNIENLLETVRSRGQLMSLEVNSDQTEGSLETLKEIVGMDLIERFNLAEKIAKKDKAEKRNDSFHTITYIDLLIKDLRVFLKLNFNNQKIRGRVLFDIKKMLENKEKIRYNTNSRLVLENIFLQTLDSETYQKGNYVK